MKECIICSKEANQTGSHIVPMNLIKGCIGNRGDEISYGLNLLSGEHNLYLGNNIKHKSRQINQKKTKETFTNPYILDYILCYSCEKKLGEIEGRVYSEILCKIKDNKFKNNFKNINVNNFEVLIPISKRIKKSDLDIYFYSIILRLIHLYKQRNIKLDTIKNIKDYINNNLYNLQINNPNLNSGLIVYLTDNNKLFPTMLKSNLYNKLIIPCCNLFIVFEEEKCKTPFGDCINLISDSDFKFIKNSVELDSAFSLY